LKKNDIVDIFDPDRIKNLKKEVEWKKVQLLGNYEINLYILSKHPEIISNEDYRKFLRQSVERVKVAVSKVEEVLKKDSHGLQVNRSEYGKHIFYSNNEILKKEWDEYVNLPEEKKQSSNYAKKEEYAAKIRDSLFKENSPTYIGISEQEFTNSDELVEYIEKLLDRNEAATINKEQNAPQQNAQSNKFVGKLIYWLTAFFVFLKLTDSVDWSWFAAISPILIWEGFGFVVGFLRGLNK
jgi:hypothetical protein